MSKQPENTNNIEYQLMFLMKKDPEKFKKIIENSLDKYKEINKKEMTLKINENHMSIDGSLYQDYFISFEKIDNWLENCLDEIRTYVRPILYPIFVYLFLGLIESKKFEKAKEFLNKNKKKFPKYENEINVFELIEPPMDKNNSLVMKYTQNKVHFYIPKEIFNFFLHFLDTHKLVLVLDILNNHFANSSLLSKISDMDDEDKNKIIILKESAEDVDNINGKTQIYTNLIDKSTVDSYLKGRNKLKGSKTLLSKVLIPMPEQLTSLPFPDDSHLQISAISPPNIGCVTLLNASSVISLELDSGCRVLAAGLVTGVIEVWPLDPEVRIGVSRKDVEDLEEYRKAGIGEGYKLKNIDKITGDKEGGKKVEENIEDNKGKVNNENKKEKDNGEENIIKNEKDENKNINEDKVNTKFIDDLVFNSRRHFLLFGHSSSVLSLSFSPDTSLLISGSSDGDLRLWSLLLRSCVAVFHGHFSPILDVAFSPRAHYFASAGCDRVARLWASGAPGALRVFVGHLGEVEIVMFHCNGMYLLTSSNDKTIRLWSINNGECVRIFVNYSLSYTHVDSMCFSNSGKLLIIAVDKNIIIYDLINNGDPISILKDISSSTILTISVDLDEQILFCCNSDFQVILFDLPSLLSSQPKILYSYKTKKTTIMQVRCCSSNMVVLVGRFGDNDPKIFN